MDYFYDKQCVKTDKTLKKSEKYVGFLRFF